MPNFFPRSKIFDFYFWIEIEKTAPWKKNSHLSSLRCKKAFDDIWNTGPTKCHRNFGNLTLKTTLSPPRFTGSSSRKQLLGFCPAFSIFSVFSESLFFAELSPRTDAVRAIKYSLVKAELSRNPSEIACSALKIAKCSFWSIEESSFSLRGESKRLVTIGDATCKRGCKIIGWKPTHLEK